MLVKTNFLFSRWDYRIATFEIGHIENETYVQMESRSDEQKVDGGVAVECRSLSENFYNSFIRTLQHLCMYSNVDGVPTMCKCIKKNVCAIQ